MPDRSRRARQQSLWIADSGPQPPVPPESMASVLPEGFAEAIDELVEPFAEAVLSARPLIIDTMAASLAGALRASLDDPDMAGPPPTLDQALAARPDTSGRDEVVVSGVLGLLSAGAAAGRPGFADTLAALTVYGGPLLAGRARSAAADLDRPVGLVGPVGRLAGRAGIERAYLVCYVTGEAFEIVLELSYPDVTDRPAYLFTFDTFDGPTIVELDVVDDLGELLAEMGEHAQLVDVDEVPVADALSTMHHAFSVFDRTIGAGEEYDERVLQRPLIDLLIASQPRSEVLLGTDTVEVTDRGREQLAADLTSWVESRSPELGGAAAAFVPLMIDFATDRAGGPHRWTAATAIRFLEMASTKVLAPAEDLAELPQLVRQTISWAHAHNDWPAELTNDALAAVDQIRPLFTAEIEGRGVTDAEAMSVLDDLATSVTASEPGAAELRELLAAATGLGLPAPSSVQPPAGGSHPEPFDDTGIPSELVERAVTIAEAASASAAELFDDEMVTVVRRFAADAARHPDRPFERGKADIWASGVVYAVAQVNDIPGGWNRLAQPSSALTDRLSGAPSTIINKARSLRTMLDVPHPGAGLGGETNRYQHSAAVMDLGSMLVGLGGLGGLDRLGSVPIGQPSGVDSAEIDDGCFVLQAALLDIRPEIWRRIRVPIDATFAQLHQLLQLSFGWTDSHLHRFDVDGFTIGPVLNDNFGLDGDADETEVQLCDVLTPGSELVYDYDFGDGWQHRIVVEELQLQGSRLEHGPWALLGGAMACPPEDCGGPWGYRELLRARKDRSHPRHGEVADFLPPGFNPKHFDVTTINGFVRRRDWSAPYDPGIW